jgi:hypothetical protein
MTLEELTAKAEDFNRQLEAATRLSESIAEEHHAVAVELARRISWRYLNT